MFSIQYMAKKTRLKTELFKHFENERFTLKTVQYQNHIINSKLTKLFSLKWLYKWF